MFIIFTIKKKKFLFGNIFFKKNIRNFNLKSEIIKKNFFNKPFFIANSSNYLYSNDLFFLHMQDAPFEKHDSALIHDFFFSNNIYFSLSSYSTKTFLSSFLLNKNFLPQLFDYDKIDIYYQFTPEIHFTTPKEEYAHLRSSPFLNFFLINGIDVPICFNKSASLKYKINQLSLLKFANYLMKKGKREQLVRFFSIALNIFFKQIKIQKFEANLFFIQNFSFFMNFYWQLNFFFEPDKPLKTLNGLTKKFNSKFIYNSFGYEKNLLNFFLSSNFSIKDFYLSYFQQILPIFTFYIYNVDKKIRKYSRGKTGKYVFIWKYVAAFKRQKTVFKLISKQVKFYQNKTFILRIISLLTDLYFNVNKNFVNQTKKFSYNYVYKNFKYTLMSNFKTLSS